MSYIKIFSNLLYLILAVTLQCLLSSFLVLDNLFISNALQYTCENIWSIHAHISICQVEQAWGVYGSDWVPLWTFHLTHGMHHTVFGRLELEWCERKTLLPGWWLEASAGAMWERNTVGLEAVASIFCRNNLSNKLESKWPSMLSGTGIIKLTAIHIHDAPRVQQSGRVNVQKPASPSMIAASAQHLCPRQS